MVRTWNRWDARRHWPGRHRPPGERPWPGPEGPGRQAAQGHGGRTPDRTFYGPHLEPLGFPPVLAWATPVTQGKALAWTGRTRQTGDPGPRWPNPGPDILWSAPGTAWMPASIGSSGAAYHHQGHGLAGTGPGQAGFPVGQLRQDAACLRSKSGHSMVRTPLPEDPHQHSVPRGYVRSSGIRSRLPISRRTMPVRREMGNLNIEPLMLTSKPRFQ